MRRLILTLVLGPFLILLLFGIGYRNQARDLRTLFVVANGKPAGKTEPNIQSEEPEQYQEFGSL